jgi:hypothetical protein
MMPAHSSTWLFQRVNISAVGNPDDCRHGRSKMAPVGYVGFTLPGVAFSLPGEPPESALPFTAPFS